MMYNTLRDLLQNSQSSRTYFLSLPVEQQKRLHEYDACVHSAAQLHDMVESLEKYAHKVTLGGWTI